MSAQICTWPSCKCTARGQCNGLGARADLCDPMQDARVKRLVEAANYAAREIQDYIDDDTGILPLEEARDTLRAALRDLEQG